MELPLPTLDALVELVTTGTESRLDQLTAATSVSRQLGNLGEELLSSVVAECRQDGYTWIEIGKRLGVTRQAAQQRFSEEGRDDKGIGDFMNRVRGVINQRHAHQAEADEQGRTVGSARWADAVKRLVEGPAERLGDVLRSTGGPAGVFTLWYRERLLYLGHARQAAWECRDSNRHQADGARGRLVGVRRQPPVSIQLAFQHFFSADLAGTSGPTAQKRAAELLQGNAQYRLVETDTGKEAVELFHFAESWLAENGHNPLADQDA